jgi:hypothetical protein
MTLSRVIKTESAGKDRNRLTREVVVAIRELMRQTQPDDTSKDLAVFIAIALFNINATIDVSVVAWEKRGYWVKADRFRLEWEWTGRMAEQMKKAVLADDWASIAMISAQVGQKLMSVKIPDRHRVGTPWVGAWKQMQLASQENR